MFCAKKGQVREFNASRVASEYPAKRDMALEAFDLVHAFWVHEAILT